MAPGTHALIGWWTANVLPLSRRDRFFVFFAGVAPDLDGLGFFFSEEAYFKYHHVLCHHLVGCVLFVLGIGLLAKERIRCMTLAFLSWHLHLACDYFGSRGPWDSRPWPLPYFYPMLGSHADGILTGPSWYWNPWQWPLNAWPNVVFTLLAFAGWVYVAVRLDRTWFEFIWLRFDQEVCRTLRKWFGGQPAKQWSDAEARVILKSFLVLSVVAVCACVVAASKAHE